MSENPYSPPKSEVRDRAPDRAIAERPRQVLYAVLLLWISLVLGIPSSIHEYQKAVTVGTELSPLVFMLFLYAFGVCLNISIARGYNWTRFALLVFSSVATVSFIAFIEVYLQDPVGYLALNVITLVMNVVALYLLFSRPGALWFRLVH